MFIIIRSQNEAAKDFDFSKVARKMSVSNRSISVSTSLLWRFFTDVHTSSSCFDSASFIRSLRLSFSLSCFQVASLTLRIKKLQKGLSSRYQPFVSEKA